jgi:hypothetical protein
MGLGIALGTVRVPASLVVEQEAHGLSLELPAQGIPQNGLQRRKIRGGDELQHEAMEPASEGFILASPGDELGQEAAFPLNLGAQQPHLALDEG